MAAPSREERIHPFFFFPNSHPSGTHISAPGLVQPYDAVLTDQERNGQNENTIVSFLINLRFLNSKDKTIFRNDTLPPL